MEEEYQYEDLGTEHGKLMLKLAYEWIGKRSDHDRILWLPNDVDITEIYKDNGQAFIEANCFLNGKYYTTSFSIPEEWLKQRLREEKLKEIGI
jgi:hypothetical protein